LNYLIHEGNNITDSLNRIVVVTSYSDYLEDNDLFMSLIGENGITITQGNTYTDPGAIAIDKIDGNISNKIATLSDINVNVPGSYSIKYNISNSNGKKASIERIVNVIPKTSDIVITSSFTPTTSTNKDVSINVSISGKDYDKTLLPNSLFTYTKEINYKVSYNGTYTFKIYDKNGEIKNKTIVINNIDKTAPAGTCNAVILNGKTNISVNSFNNDISGYIELTNQVQQKLLIIFILLIMRQLMRI
jgi:hypothetical protein